MTDVPITIPRSYTRLEAQISIIVPSTKHLIHQKKITNSEMMMRVHEVQKYLSTLFGGHTSYNATGGYVMKKGGRLVNEDIIKVTAFGEKEVAIRNKNKLFNKLSQWAAAWGQESIGLEWEGDFILIPRKR